MQVVYKRAMLFLLERENAAKRAEKSVDLEPIVIIRESIYTNKKSRGGEIDRLLSNSGTYLNK